MFQLYPHGFPQWLYQSTIPGTVEKDLDSSFPTPSLAMVAICFLNFPSSCSDTEIQSRYNLHFCDDYRHWTLKIFTGLFYFFENCLFTSLAHLLIRSLGLKCFICITFYIVPILTHCQSIADKSTVGSFFGYTAAIKFHAISFVSCLDYFFTSGILLKNDLVWI